MDVLIPIDRVILRINVVFTVNEPQDLTSRKRESGLGRLAKAKADAATKIAS